MMLILLAGCLLQNSGDPLPEGALLRLGTTRWRHGGYVHGVAFSPDGRRALSCANAAILWDVESGRALLTLAGDPTEVEAVSFGGDGRRALTGGYNGGLVLWDLERGAELRRINAHDGWVGGISVTTDGRRALSGGMDGKIALWDLETGARVKSFEGTSGPVSAVALSPDQTLAAAGAKKGAALWNTETGELVKKYSGDSENLRSLAFSPDGKFLAMGGIGGVEVVEARTGERRWRIDSQMGRVQGLTYRHDGKSLAAAVSDGTLQLWESDSGKPLRTLRGHHGQLFSVAFSPDGRRLLSGAADATVGLWDAESGEHLNATPEVHGHEVLAAAFGSDGRWAATGSTDGTVALWDRATGKRLRVLRPNAGTVWSVAPSPDGRRLAAAVGGRICLWETATGRALPMVDPDNGMFYSVAFHPEGRQLAATANRLYIMDADDGSLLRTLETPHSPIGAGFSTDGLTLHAAVENRKIGRWATGTAKPLEGLSGTWGSINSIAAAPDGSGYLVGGSEPGIFWVDARSGASRRLDGEAPSVKAAAISPDGRLGASGGYDGVVRLWDLRAGKLLRVFVGHRGAVYAVAFSPGGRDLISASGDTTAIVWRTSVDAASERPEADLAESDVTLAMRGRERLIALGEEGVRRLVRTYPARSSAPVAEEVLEDLGRRLDAEDPKAREQAFLELERHGARARSWILKAAAEADRPPEARARLGELAARSPAALRMDEPGTIGAVEVLAELFPSKEAETALRLYAEGPRDSYARLLARRALSLPADLVK